MFVRLTAVGTTGTGTETTIYELEVLTNAWRCVRRFEELVAAAAGPEELMLAINAAHARLARMPRQLDAR